MTQSLLVECNLTSTGPSSVGKTITVHHLDGSRDFFESPDPLASSYEILRTHAELLQKQDPPRKPGFGSATNPTTSNTAMRATWLLALATVLELSVNPQELR